MTAKISVCGTEFDEVKNMICTNCGAKLMDTDQFCPRCGAKAIKDKRCPDCGAVLRDGTRFCHKCGRQIDGEVSADKVSNETLDIPIVDIERNILSETAAEIKADHRTSALRRTSSNGNTPAHISSSKNTSSKSAASHDSVQKNKPVRNTSPKNNTSPKKARAGYREEEDWDDEDDWDDEEEEGTDIITIMTAVVGCVLLVVVAVLGYHLYQQYMPRNYGDAAKQQEDDISEEQQGQGMEDGWEVEISEPETSFDLTLTVTHNVNVRDNPSTSGSNILKVAQEGETYRCNGSVKGEWYEILLDDGTIGYVFYEYVTVE